MSVLRCSDQLLQQDLEGKVFLVTGGNSGIGLETVKQLARQGGTVVFTVRQISAGQAIAEGINSGLTRGNKVEAMEMDLSSFCTVKSFAEKFKEKYRALHVLINNAGIMNTPTLQMNKSGLEMQFATNHLGHFLLTNHLLDLLKASSPSRIICVSSCFHFEAMGKKGRIDFDDLNFVKRPYDGWTAYAQSKLANVLHAQELARRLTGTGVTAVSLHPGWVRTNLVKNTVPLWVQNCLCAPVFRARGMIEPWEGMQTTLFCALDPSVPANSGKYYSQAGNYGKRQLSGWPLESPSDQLTEEIAARLWAESECLVEGKIPGVVAVPVPSKP